MIFRLFQPLLLALSAGTLFLVVVSAAEEQQDQQHNIRRAQDGSIFGSNIQHGYINRLAGGEGIIGGSEAAAGEFPWFAAFDPLVSCGGSLIAPNRVLTAAHCVSRGAPAGVIIGPTTMSNGERIAVTCASYHPDFKFGKGGDLFNDVAILKLVASSTATPVALNSNINYPSVSGTPLTVIGYGTTSEGGRVSNVLKKVGTFFQTTATCNNNYPDVELGTHVCGNVNNEGDCQGDSGGPLFDSNNTQVGVVSYGIGCARAPEDVYAGVAKYYDWIQSEINNDTCNVEVGNISLLSRIIDCITNFGSAFIWVQSLFQAA